MTDDRRWPHSPDPQTDVVIDAKGLRALAHPVRVQLIGLLRKNGPSTATKLAEQLGLNSGATSYHLRQLAASGFVAEDTERGNARDRWWKAVHQVTWWTDGSLAEEDPEAALGYLRSVVAAHTLMAQTALNAYETMTPEWRQAMDSSDMVLQVTPEEARALAAEMWAVIARYRRIDPEGPTPEGTDRVAVVVQVLPEPQTVDDDASEDRS
ncbi:ArsR/SmtB family transcription factor [Kitasatospora purpeofusca]|uniref:ArsR/SmtB family transcription factor n=1 Tax=Kitasatospora purpeofusca TaxID=67352 RepID=UPI00386D7B40|nr:helix-turn-helix domain-containing protein [Kitasatospora purpeofusca]